MGRTAVQFVISIGAVDFSIADTGAVNTEIRPGAQVPAFFTHALGGYNVNASHTNRVRHGPWQNNVLC